MPAGAVLVGMLSQPEFRGLLARARVYVSAAAWEDFGIAPLEALDRGAALVCAPAGGPFPALGLARALAPEFVAADRSPEGLARAIEAAFAASDARSPTTPARASRTMSADSIRRARPATSAPREPT